MYYFRREDNGELVRVPFAKMMEMDSMGCIILDDGVVARRARNEEPNRAKEKTPQTHGITVRRVSDNLGCGAHEAAKAQAQARAAGFTGIEFRPDPQTPQFCQVHYSSAREYRDYVKFRGMVDKTGALGLGAGAVVSPEMLEQAQRRVSG